MKQLRNTLQLLFLLLCLPFLGILLLGFIVFESWLAISNRIIAAMMAVCHRIMAAMMEADKKLGRKTE